MIKAIAFDMDGTLVDTEPFHKEIRNALLREWGLDVEAHSARAIGMGMVDYYTMLKEEFGLNIDPVAVTKYAFSTLQEMIVARNIPLIDGAVEAFRYLKKQGIKMAIASSSIRSFVEFVISHYRLREYIRFTVCGDEVTHAKPNPEIYLKAIDKLNEKREETIAVEDAKSGSLSATRAGIRCVGLDAPVVGDRQDLSACYRTVTSLHGLIDIVKEENE